MAGNKGRYRGWLKYMSRAKKAVVPTKATVNLTRSVACFLGKPAYATRTPTMIAKLPSQPGTDTN